MCLKEVYVTKVDKDGNVSPKGGSLFGYKRLVKVDGDLSSDFNSDLVVGEWMTANNKVINAQNNLWPKYSAGFHVFLDRNDADAYDGNATFRVEFRDIVCIGKNQATDEGLTVIAKQMRLVEEV